MNYINPQRNNNEKIFKIFTYQLYEKNHNAIKTRQNVLLKKYYICQNQTIMKKTILSYVFINLLNIWLPRKQLSVSIFFCIQSDSSWIILENMSDALLSYFETFPCITDFLKLTIISPMSSGVFKHREIVMLTMVHTNFPKKIFFFIKVLILSMHPILSGFLEWTFSRKCPELRTE